MDQMTDEEIEKRENRNGNGFGTIGEDVIEEEMNSDDNLN